MFVISAGNPITLRNWVYNVVVMSKKNETIRFAFGTKENPGSAVWRINIIKKTGDVYINNAPVFGLETHISLHSSGIFSMKLGKNKRHPLQPPCIIDGSNLINGPCIFFSGDKSNVKPPEPSGSIENIKWLGWPEDGNLVTIRIYYSNIDTKIITSENEILIASSLPVKLFHKDMLLHIIAEYRLMSEEEKNSPNTIFPYKDFRRMEFTDNIPEYIELIRVSKTKEGPSAIIIEGVNAIQIQE